MQGEKLWGFMWLRDICCNRYPYALTSVATVARSKEPERSDLPEALQELEAIDVMRYLGISRTRVLQLHKEGKIKSVRFDLGIKPHGGWIFSRESVDAYKEEREASPLGVKSVYARGSVAHEGIVAAKAFELFDQKKTITEVVRILRVKPERVRRLWIEYKTPLGQRVMTPEAERELFERQKTIKELEIADARARAAMLAASKPKGSGTP